MCCSLARWRGAATLPELEFPVSNSLLAQARRLILPQITKRNCTIIVLYLKYSTVQFTLFYVLYTLELGTRNTKTSCFVFIDTNARPLSRNTKQTRQNVETRKKHERLENLRIILEKLENFHLVLDFFVLPCTNALSRLSPIHIEAFIVCFTLFNFLLLINRIFLLVFTKLKL